MELLFFATMEMLLKKGWVYAEHEASGEFRKIGITQFPHGPPARRACIEPAYRPAEAGATGIYKNCTALNKKWSHGVGRNNAKDKTSGKPVTNFFHSTKQYNKAMNNNRGLDHDKDGIACEKR